MNYPIGAKFNPTDLGLVRLYLHNKIVNKQSRFIIPTLNVYEDEPWRIRHVTNPLFKENEWYYFVQRTKGRGTTVSRTVPGKGESEGGTWKSTAKKTKIVDGDNKVIGYKQSLVFNKKVKGKPVKTDWLMTEFSLHKEGVEFQDWVLCWIRNRQKKDEKLNIVPQYNNNIVLPNQEQQEDDFGNQLEMMMIEEKHGDVTRQQKEDTPVLLPPPLQSNDINNFMMMMPNQEQNPCNCFGFDGDDDENETISYDRLMQILDEPSDVTLTQQEQRSEERLQLHQPIPVAQDPGVYAGQDDMMMMTNNYGYTYIDVTTSLENQ